MAAKSPFLQKEVKCPSCGQSHLQRQFRSRIFVIADKEQDQHVLKYRWRDPSIQAVHPPFYFLFHCPKCYYTDTIEDFKDPASSVYCPIALEAFEKNRDKTEIVVNLLAEGIDYDEIDFPSAMRLHFLAIFEQMIAPPGGQDHYKLGRLYLRVAWLYREQAAPKEGEAPKEVKPQAAAPTEADKTLMAVTEAFEACESLVKESLEKWDGAETVLQQAVAKSLRVTENPFKPHIAEARKLHASIEAKILDLKTTYLGMDSGGGSPGEEKVENVAPVGGAKLEKSFLDKLRILWPQIPGNEVEATRSAVRHFDKALSSDRRFDNSDAYFRATSLVINLMIRAGDLDGAFSMVRGLFRTSIDERQELTEQLQEPDLDPERKGRIKAKLKRAAAALEQAGDLRRELMDSLVERELPKIKAIMAKHPNATDAQFEKALEAAGLSKGIITHLKEPAQRKRLLGK